MKPFFWFSKYYQQEPTGLAGGKSSFHIRAATPKDLTILAEILADSFHSREGSGRWVYPLLRLGIYEDLRNRLNAASPRYICLVAVALNSMRLNACESKIGHSSVLPLAGTVEMALRSAHPCFFCSAPQYPYLSNLAVHLDHRRQGVAQQLLLTCERIALEWGFQDVYLHVLENNYPARRLYFKLGYRLHQVDWSLSSLLLRRPRRLLLHKHLTATTTVQWHETGK